MQAHQGRRPELGSVRPLLLDQLRQLALLLRVSFAPTIDKPERQFCASQDDLHRLPHALPNECRAQDRMRLQGPLPRLLQERHVQGRPKLARALIDVHAGARLGRRISADGPVPAADGR